MAHEKQNLQSQGENTRTPVSKEAEKSPPTSLYLFWFLINEKEEYFCFIISLKWIRKPQSKFSNGHVVTQFYPNPKATCG